MKFHYAENHRPMGGHTKGDSPLVIQRPWRVCCQSIGEHRFDCADVPEEQRGPGPCLPVAPLTPAQLVKRLRDERAARGRP